MGGRLRAMRRGGVGKGYNYVVRTIRLNWGTSGTSGVVDCRRGEGRYGRGGIAARGSEERVRLFLC